MDYKKIRILSEKEVKLLLYRLRGRDRIVVLIGLYMGLMPDKIFRISWNDIDFDRALLKVNRKILNKTFRLPLPGVLIEELKNYVINCTEDRLFEDQSINCFVKYFFALNKKFKRLLSDDITFMALRHTFATNLIKTRHQFIL